jgi:hypothetical protein
MVARLALPILGMALLLPVGCAPTTPGPSGAVATQPAPQPAWVNLMDSTRVKQWKVIQGAASLDSNAILLNTGAGRDTTILAEGVDLQDGEVELEFRRLESPLHDMPVTIALRLPVRIDWTSVYIICRPEQVEACRGSALRRQPPAEHVQRMDKAQASPEVWRFVMTGGLVECFRFGRKVLSYVDPRPRAGTIALTASNCGVTVSAIRYRPVEKPRTGPERR